MAIGIAKLAIPRVNQNPQPPKLHQGLAQRMVARNSGATGGGVKPVAPKPIATTTAQPSNTAAPPTPGSTSSASTVAPAAPAPSNDPFAVPTFTPTNGQADPRDATYWANLAKLQFNDRQEFAKNQAEQTNANANYNFSLQQAIANRPIEERQLGEQAIKSNLGNSGWLGRSSAEQLTNYTNSRSQASLTKEQEDTARQAARQALIEGYGIDAAAELAASGGRYAANAREEAGKNGPEGSDQGTSGTEGGGSSTNTQGSKGVGEYTKFVNLYKPPKDRKPVKQAIANRRKVA